MHRPPYTDYSIRRGVMAALLSIASMTYGLPDDREQPIRITADRAVRDDLEGVTRYEGNVALTQGSLEIQAELISINHDRETTSSIIAEGKPAAFSQLPAPDQARIQASAERIEYLRDEDRVRLMTNARIEQDGATVSGDIIDYLVTEQRVQASAGDDSSGQRVEVVIPPRALDGDT